METEIYVILLWSLYYFYLCQIVFKSRKFVKYDQRTVSFFPPTWQPTEVLRLLALKSTVVYSSLVGL
jgi:hypothetical protein